MDSPIRIVTNILPSYLLLDVTVDGVEVDVLRGGLPVPLGAEPEGLIQLSLDRLFNRDFAAEWDKISPEDTVE